MSLVGVLIRRPDEKELQNSFEQKIVIIGCAIKA